MSRKPLTRILAAIGVVVGLLATLVVLGGMSADAEANGPAPHPDYLVNIIGVDNAKTNDLDDTDRRTIFVNLEGLSKINLEESEEFQVLDGNGTDKDGATLGLLDPDVDGDGVLDGTYSVHVRALGTPGGSATISTCAEIVDLGLDGELSVKNRRSLIDPDAYCTLEQYDVNLVRNNGRPMWGNVTQELLTITFEVEITVDDVTTTERITIPLFDDRIEGEFWEYNNNGLRLVQVRFTLND